MKAVVYHEVGSIRLDDVPEPQLETVTDAIVRITLSAICGTDLHMVRGTMPGMKPGTILGHEAVGVIEALGSDVRNFAVGDRVVIPSTIACGTCSYCRAGYYAQCDRANPHGNRAGTAFYGGPESTGSFAGLQAEKARIPNAHINLVKLPPDVSDEVGILLSDVFPTGYFAADLAHIHPGSTVAIFGCGPVGLFAIVSARAMGAGRVFAVDSVPSRLEMARVQGAEVIDFTQEDPVETILRLTSNIGVDRAIDAVGVDAEGASTEGGAPSPVLSWAIDALAKAGQLAIVGVYPPNVRAFPLGDAMNKNLTLRMGNCNHRKYIPKLLELVRSHTIDPTRLLTRREKLVDAVEAYRHYDRHDQAWVKVALRAA